MSSALSANGDWGLALDLLVARSVLDPALRAKLLATPEDCCKANGVSMPEGLRLVLIHPDQPTLIREILSTLNASSFEKTGITPQLRGPVVYNGTTEYTETNTTITAETSAQGEDAFSSESTSSEAEVVVVLT